MTRYVALSLWNCLGRISRCSLGRSVSLGTSFLVSKDFCHSKCVLSLCFLHEDKDVECSLLDAVAHASLALGRPRQVDLWVQGQPGLHSKFQDSQDCYRKTLSQKTENKKKSLLTSILMPCLCFTMTDSNAFKL